MCVQWGNLDDVCRDVADALGYYADDFDIEAIARECYELDERQHFHPTEVWEDADYFWDCVQAHEIVER